MKQSVILIYFCYLLPRILTGTSTENSACMSLEWRCKSGQCIPLDAKCDGVVNCGDGSDESAEFCLETTCPEYSFKCAYGACIRGTSKCNGIKDCADNSDESVLLCGTGSGRFGKKCPENYFQCDSGDCIWSDEHCDGRKNCADGSDETLKSCKTVDCPMFSFKCAYGACISGRFKCNGINECHDGSDEAKDLCGSKIGSPLSGEPGSCRVTLGSNMIIALEMNQSLPINEGDFVNDVSSIIYTCNRGYSLLGRKDNVCFRGSWAYPPPKCMRTSAENSPCMSLQWQCKSGQCIPLDAKCDGVVNCGDGSDESAEFCLETTCPEYSFKCAYGACISGTLKCNGIKDCIDNSDESILLCGTRSGRFGKKCPENYFQCDSGDCIWLNEHCDGRKNCADGSDETLKTCKTVDCPMFSFKCAYGACVRGSAKCNGINECHDGSDEAKDICGERIETNVNLPLPSDTTSSRLRSARSTEVGSCRVVLGPNMIITAENDPSLDLKNGDLINDLSPVKYKCKSGYTLFGPADNLCFKGSWVYGPPECLKTCPNTVIEGITFHVTCAINRTRVSCEGPIRPGTIAMVTCARGYKKPDRSVRDTLICDTSGEWDYHSYSCVPICGQKTAEQYRALRSIPVSISQVPWYATIYRRGDQGAEHICGGTIISAKLVISAAHCVWSESIDSTKYLVVVGKNNRDYIAMEKSETQVFDVSEIHIARGYLGESTSYQNDIAVLVLNKFIRYQSHIKPACLEWRNYAKRDLLPDTMGEIAGWGRFSVNGSSSDDLRASTLPVIDRAECLKKVEPGYEPLIAGDKFCVGSPNIDAAPCQGASGGGFLVPKRIEGIPTYFLEGVVSTSLSKEKCGTEYYIALTNIQYHELMIKELEARFKPK